MVSCRRSTVKKGTWTAEEDALLLAFVKEHGAAGWNTAQLLFPDLNRSGKSCRLRYLNQLHPRIRRGPISPFEESIILIAHSILGNQWSRIAALLPGRTDNAVKNVVNMRLKRARRHAASVNFASRAVGMQQGYPSNHSTMHVSPETCNNIPLPTSACGVLSVLPSLKVTTGGTYDSFGSPASSPKRYNALVAGGGAPVMNIAAAGMGECMDEHSLDAGMMTITTKTLSPMHVTGNKKVGTPEVTNINLAPIGSYQKWMMQAPFTSQELQERLPGIARLPSSQNLFESAQLPSVQRLFESLLLSPVQEPLQSLEGLELPSVEEPSRSLEGFETPSAQEPFQSLLLGSVLPSVEPLESLECLELPSVKEPSRSLEGFELPSAQEPFQSLLLGSELPSVQSQCPQADMANQFTNLAIGDNDLLEAIKLTGYRSSSSNFKVGSSSPASILDSGDSYLSTLLMGIETSDQLLITSSTTSFPASSSASLVCNGIEGDLASMMLGSSMWSSMPGACQVGETAGKDCIPDFN